MEVSIISLGLQTVLRIGILLSVFLDYPEEKEPEVPAASAIIPEIKENNILTRSFALVYKYRQPTLHNIDRKYTLSCERLLYNQDDTLVPFDQSP